MASGDENRLGNLQNYNNPAAPVRPPTPRVKDLVPEELDPINQFNQDYMSLINNPLYWETKGGPNQSAIAALSAQKAAATTNYEQNKADVSNLYGQLTQDMTTYGADLQTRYDTTISDTETGQSNYQTELQQRQAKQDETRATAASELGLAIESLQSAPSTVLDQIAQQSQAASNNWTNLLKANKLFEEGSTSRQIAGADYNKISTLTGLKNYLDQTYAQIDAQLQAERSKSPTRQLNDLGQAQQAGMFDVLDRIWNPEDADIPLYSENPIIARMQQAFESEGRSMDNAADMEWYSNTYESIVNKINNAGAGTSPGLNPEEKRFMEAFDLSTSGLGIIDPALLQNYRYGD